MSSPQFYDWVTALLKTIKDNRIAPPQAARWFFLACSLAWDALQYASDDSLHAIDTSFQSVGKGARCGSNMLISFVFKAIHQSWSLLFSSYMRVPTTHIDAVWASQSSLIYPYPQVTSQLAIWMNRASIYLAARDNDGYKTASTPPGPIINNGHFIVSTGYSSPGVIQNLSTIPNMSKWTPIQTSGVTQSYLVPGWGNVAPIVNVSSQTDAIGTAFYPKSDAIHNNSVNDVLKISEALTDQEKMIAEFWVGGANTVTPPGSWMFIASKIAQYLKQDLLTQLSMFKYVSAALFQAGISAWYLKWKYQQARPVQLIRYLHNGETAPNWTGTIDLGTWQPYQSLSGITPPHPDFVSGHSTFSSAAARALDLFLKTTSVPTIQFDSSDLLLLSPMFQSNIGKTCMNTFICYPGCSNYQPGVVPESGVTLSYNSWDEMANSAGISRIYGGIHVEASNQGGLALGRMIGDNVFAAL